MTLFKLICREIKQPVELSGRAKWGLARFQTLLRWPWGVDSTGAVCKDSRWHRLAQGRQDTSESHRSQTVVMTDIYEGCRELWGPGRGVGGEGDRIFLLCTICLSPFYGGLDPEGEKGRNHGEMAHVVQSFPHRP